MYLEPGDWQLLEELCHVLGTLTPAEGTNLVNLTLIAVV